MSVTFDQPLSSRLALFGIYMGETIQIVAYFFYFLFFGPRLKQTLVSLLFNRTTPIPKFQLSSLINPHLEGHGFSQFHQCRLLRRFIVLTTKVSELDDEE